MTTDLKHNFLLSFAALTLMPQKARANTLDFSAGDEVEATSKPGRFTVLKISNNFALLENVEDGSDDPFCIVPVENVKKLSTKAYVWNFDTSRDRSK